MLCKIPASFEGREPHCGVGCLTGTAQDSVAHSEFLVPAF